CTCRSRCSGATGSPGWSCSSPSISTSHGRASRSCARGHRRRCHPTAPTQEARHEGGPPVCEGEVRGRGETPGRGGQVLRQECLRSDLLDRNVTRDPQKAGGREVTVEREGMADPLRAHDGEARRVDEAEVLVGVLPQQTERPSFGLVMDEYPVEPLRILEVVEEPHRRRMTANHAQERVGLPDHMVGGDQGGCPREETAQRPYA